MYGSPRCRPGGPSALAWRSGLGPRWRSPVRMTGDLEGCFRPRLLAAGELEGGRGAAALYERAGLGHSGSIAAALAGAAGGGLAAGRLLR